MRLLLIFFFIIGCKTPHSLTTIEQLESDIKTNWKYSEENGKYSTNGEFLIKVNSEYKKDLLGMSDKEIVALFGEPTKKRGAEYKYFTSATCEKEWYYEVIFHFNNDSIVKQMFVDCDAGYREFK